MWVVYLDEMLVAVMVVALVDMLDGHWDAFEVVTWVVPLVASKVAVLVEKLAVAKVVLLAV